MPSPEIRSRAMRVSPIRGNLAEVHAKNFLRRRVIHRSCGEQLLRALLTSMNNSGIAISPRREPWGCVGMNKPWRGGRKSSAMGPPSLSPRGSNARRRPASKGSSPERQDPLPAPRWATPQTARPAGIRARPGLHGTRPSTTRSATARRKLARAVRPGPRLAPS